MGDKKFLLWTAGEQVLNTNVDVLVVCDDDDADIDEVDKAYGNARSVLLADQLTVFNSRPFADRKIEIERFGSDRAGNRLGGRPFGVDPSMHEFLELNPTEMTLLPIVR